MDEMAKQFNEALDDRIDHRADFKAKRAALSASIRSRLELHVSGLSVPAKKQKEVAPMLEALTEQFVSNTINAAKGEVQNRVFAETGVVPPMGKIGEHVCAPLLDHFGEMALASLTTANAK